MEDYYALDRKEMLHYIPSYAKRIVDIGCGAGFFANKMKEVFGAEIWGVEYVSEQAEQARLLLDKVFLGKIEDNIDNLPNGYFDCIVMNDVLEHLSEPWDILDKLRIKLSEKGVFVCSIPNVRFWKNMLRFIFLKDWKYEDFGILDRTHLRFFTKKSIRRVIGQLDFDLLCIKGINRTQTWKARLFHPFLVLLGQGDCQYLQFACVFRNKTAD